MITLYTARFCGYCLRAKRLLDDEGLNYREIAVDGDRAMRAELEARTGRSTVPQIWFGELHVGGYRELRELQKNGQLQAVISQSETTASAPSPATSNPNEEYHG